MPKHPLLNFTAPSQRTKQLTVAVILILIVANCSNKRHDCEFTATCTAESSEVGNAGGTSGQGNTASAAAGLAGTAGTDAGAGASSTGGQFQASACGETCPKDKPLCDEAKASCVTCLSDNDCASTPETPACTLYSTNECVECLYDSHCPAALSHCLGTRKCAECSRNEHCSGATPYCNMDTYKCVECRSSSECDATSAKPACNPKNLCVPCLYDYHCKTAEASRCDTATNNCVSCLSNADCKTATASKCDLTEGSPTAHTCLPCTADSECSEISGKSVCLTGVTGQGNQCVQCTAAKEVACNATSCNPKTHACTTTPRNSVGLCGACVADSECATGTGITSSRCIPMTFGPSATPHGSYCLEAISSGCDRPFGDTSVMRITKVSASGAPSDDYCGIIQELVTCEAILDMKDANNTIRCTNTTTSQPDDTLCGRPRDANGKCTKAGEGGLCRTIDSQNRCTIQCGGGSECITNYTCISPAPNYCG